MERPGTSQAKALTDLPWDDVIIPHIVARLPLSTVFNLRKVSLPFQEIVDRYFETAHTLDNSDPCITWARFEIMARNSLHLKSLKFVCPNVCLEEFGFSLYPIIEANKNTLKTVDIFLCPNSIGNVLHPLTNTDRPNSLRELRLYCDDMQTNVKPANLLVEVAKANRGLTVLSLTNIFALTDRILEDIATNCRGLREITLMKCEQLTDRSLLFVACRCLKLKKLHVSMCWRLTDRGFRISEYCKELSELEVSGCRDVTDGIWFSNKNVAKVTLNGAPLNLETILRNQHLRHAPRLQI